MEELNQQVQAGASPELLRQTLALLQFEVDRQTGSTTRSLGTAKVAVVLPTPAVSLERSPDLDTPTTSPAPRVLFDEEFVVEQLTAPMVSAPETSVAEYNVMEEVPTLYMHRNAELNEQLLTEIPSVNDQLNVPVSVQHDRLQAGPVADLRKAIGINERFQFIRELFRSDEAMYERSIKTINQFQVFPEADLWINRELKTKLGWPIDHPLVKLFDQLVKRRFS